MHALRNFYQDQLTETPKKLKSKQKTGRSKHLGWVFLTNNMSHKPKAVRTYQSLRLASNEYTYFTPNTFFHSQSREQASLRWINAVSVDFDVKDVQGKVVSFLDLLDLIEIAGLPSPSLVVKTPSGGYHIHWYLKEPRRAFKPVITHVKRVTGLMIEEIGADQKANGPERYFRVPTEDNIIYQSNDRVSFDELCDWYSIEVERRQEMMFQGAVNFGVNLFNHPAIKKLLQGVGEGQRDNTCYTLALAYKSIGLDEDMTEEKLQEWNKKNQPSMNQIDIKRKVKSAFKPGSPLGPSSKFITQLSGIPFSYQIWEPKKERSERKYSHYDEWENDVLAHIRFRGGSISGSQRSLSEEIRSTINPKLKISYSTFKQVIKNLVDSGKILKTVDGKGRGAITTITIQAQENAQDMAAVASDALAATSNSENGLNSNTPIVKVEGGTTFALPGSSSSSSLTSADLSVTSSSLAPSPANVPERFVSAFWNRGFRDGRFIFGAWGKVQLAFKAFDIPFRTISSIPRYMQLVIDAVGFTVAAKGALSLGNFQGQDAFYRYLFGTVKGLLTNYRQEDLEAFIEETEYASLEDLYIMQEKLKEQLYKKPYVDPTLIKDKLQEVETEISFRRRKETVKKTKFYDFFTAYIDNN